MKYFWAEGFHPPKGVDVDAVGEAVEIAKNPNQLLEDSKDDYHCLHNHFWSESDAVWAEKGRLESARHIIASVKKVYNIGGQKIESRVVEFVRESGKGQWATMDDILSDIEMQDAYLAEIQRLSFQAAVKLDNFRKLIRKAAGLPKRPPSSELSPPI